MKDFDLDRFLTPVEIVKYKRQDAFGRYDTLFLHIDQGQEVSIPKLFSDKTNLMYYLRKYSRKRKTVFRLRELEDNYLLKRLK